MFEKYVEQRSGPAKIASDSSREFADLIYDQVSHHRRRYRPFQRNSRSAFSDLSSLLAVPLSPPLSLQ